ncbi:phosphatase PAP2 family protein [Modestobacter sp. I12A-02628]|uniref:Phosphatase PAP2 family protein n=1 Tax=Goekera deserti TaxID=2497753 RepID=A0A7K3W7Q2_9ACTN|nr:phosphatase PAP2 family protein [Goekera deserti]MPQ99876.1 phosphatase PAP2 family protein [Goekera deserti]NDI50035.1 phosphatase PAP2 family protein [Goekera deserti]NEL52488.1 phosphatase PAP2 family protein [Goekera deserti]
MPAPDLDLLPPRGRRPAAAGAPPRRVRTVPRSFPAPPSPSPAREAAVAVPVDRAVPAGSRVAGLRAVAGRWVDVGALGPAARWLTGALLVVYALLTVAVLARTWLVELDADVYNWGPAAHWPALAPLADAWVLLGQRAVCLVIAVLWLGARLLRDRDPRPLCTLAVATLMVNVSVGLVKTVLGRLGPLQLGAGATAPGATSVFTDGTIFPSGHTANAVVTWGVLVLVARSYRRTGAVLAAVLAVTVGLTTVYLGTHWVSDVLAGWVAGALVLLLLPVAGPLVDRSARVLSGLPARARGLRAPVGRPGRAPVPGALVASRRGPRPATADS